MNEVEDSMSGEGGHNQPDVLLEACHRERNKGASDHRLQNERPHGACHDREQDVIGGNRHDQRRVEDAVAIQAGDLGKDAKSYCQTCANQIFHASPSMFLRAR